MPNRLFYGVELHPATPTDPRSTAVVAVRLPTLISAVRYARQRVADAMQDAQVYGTRTYYRFAQIYCCDYAQIAPRIECARVYAEPSAAQVLAGESTVYIPSDRDTFLPDDDGMEGRTEPTDPETGYPYSQGDPLPADPYAALESERASDDGMPLPDDADPLAAYPVCGGCGYYYSPAYSQGDRCPRCTPTVRALHR